MTTAAPISKHRLEALADGIYAIALTLLVLDLKLPPMEHPTQEALLRLLQDALPKGLVWLLSFWVMATFWLAQQRVLRHYALLDGLALRLELCQLALVSLLPFSTDLIGEHGSFVASSAIYAAHMALLALLSLLRVVWLQRHSPLRAPDSDAAELAALTKRAQLVFACSLAATALAFVSPGWNMLVMLFLMAPGGWRRHAHAG